MMSRRYRIDEMVLAAMGGAAFTAIVFIAFAMAVRCSTPAFQHQMEDAWQGPPMVATVEAVWYDADGTIHWKARSKLPDVSWLRGPTE